MNVRDWDKERWVSEVQHIPRAVSLFSKKLWKCRNNKKAIN